MNNRQAVFVEEYLTCWNAAEAARRAGYSEKTARAIGAENLTKPDVQAAIVARLSELKATADEVMARLTAHSRASMEDFIDVAAQSLDLEKAEKRGKLHLIKKFRATTTTVSKPTGEDVQTHYTEIELHDAQAATVQLARILGLSINRVEVTWKTELEQRGFNASAVFERMVSAAATALAERNDGGGGSGSDQETNGAAGA